ncbi:MAG: hypothetical protein ACYDHP_03625 [Ferrimicrobium sp.]
MSDRRFWETWVELLPNDDVGGVATVVRVMCCSEGMWISSTSRVVAKGLIHVGRSDS